MHGVVDTSVLIDVQDMWIAATAKAHGAMLFTQDGDFTRFEGVEVVRV